MSYATKFDMQEAMQCIRTLDKQVELLGKQMELLTRQVKLLKHQIHHLDRHKADKE